MSIVDVLYVANGLLSMCQAEKEIAYSTYLDIDYMRQTGLAEHLDEWLLMAKDLITRSS